MPSVYEEEDAQIILIYFFGLEAENWTINDKVVEMIGVMLSGNKVCSTVFDLVPRPGFVDKGYIARQLRGIARRIKSGESYETCRVVIALKWRSPIIMASQGL